MYSCTANVLPGQHYEVMLIELLGVAASEVILCSFIFTDSKDLQKKLKSAISAAIQRGVIVRIFANGRWAKPVVAAKQRRIIESFSELGAKCKISSFTGVDHRKIIVVDRSIVVIGSHNLSHHSFRRNKELSVLLKSSELATEVINILKDDYPHSFQK